MADIVTLFPPILRWARQNAKFTKENVLIHFAQKSKVQFGVDAHLLNSLEAQPTPLRIGLLKELANLYGQPLAVFFLEDLPPLPKDLADLRTFKNRPQSEISPATMQVVRSARQVQSIGQELSEELAQPVRFQFSAFNPTATNSDTLADQMRARFGLTSDKQRLFRSPDDLFKWLRTTIEKSGVFVLKEPFPLVDALGFSLTEEEPFVIVINSKWGGRSYAPKIFSLLHEFAHVLLRSGGLCNDFTYSARGVETFCNRFAAEFLIPAAHFKSELRKLAPTFDPGKVEEYLAALGDVFKASKPALLLRFLEHGFIDQTFFDKKIVEWNAAYEREIATTDDIPFRVLPHTRALGTKGTEFTSLVVRALVEHKITRDAAADFLNIQPPDLPLVAKRLKTRL